MPLTPSEVEVKFLSSLVDESDVRQAQSSGITQDSFILYGEIFQYMVDYMHMYESRLPKPADVEAHFRETDFAMEFESAGDLSFYTDELSKLSLTRRIRESIRNRVGEGALRLESDPYEVARLLLDDFQGFRHQRSQSVSMFDRDALERLEWIETRIQAVAGGEMLGIPTGLMVFDKFQQGWQPGEAIMLIGPKGAGKSWLLMNMACLAYGQGKRILFLSPEMSWEECALRFDVLLAHQYHREFSHTSLTTGAMINLDDYRDWLTNLTAREDFICVDNADINGFTLPSILSLAQEYQPDVIVLDGIHLVKNQSGEVRWETIKEAADGLKAYVQRTKTVILWCGQVDREGMRNRGEPVSTGAQAAYSKAAVEAANRLITMGVDTDNSLRRTFKVPNNRSGRTWDETQYLDFDIDIGRIEQVEIIEPRAFGVLADGSEF